ncbi:hypothetical protein [Paenibacillus donghaensis]|uniref:Nucleotide-diphospho-sugar transferase domain-containing protein n=1 Tax=Paenibacillus donghaensis TaxID=414771 RepID=A0A2Z2K5J2_9BACL|nr:hypothetical protein [Paenibacillus donghaensis]ASA19857.1 hypothetical protein B9T62_02985 [Paenibacillus donghaensis]
MIIGTVVTMSGLPKAILMANSVKQHMPHVKIAVCVVEENISKDGYLPEIDRIFTAKELSDYVGFKDFERYIFKFNSLQCAAAMKGQLIKYLLEAYPEEQHIVYFDPTMYVFKPLTELEQMLSHYDVVLTPHHLEPSEPWDCSREIGTLQDGTFHSGLVAVKNSQEGRSFANWWLNIIAGDFEGQSNTIFTDQPYLNFVPAYFNAGILRHPGYQLAFWNLHESSRKLYQENGQYLLTNRVPLCCTNLSNFLGLLDYCLEKLVPDHTTYTILWNDYKEWLSHMIPLSD